MNLQNVWFISTSLILSAGVSWAQQSIRTQIEPLFAAGDWERALLVLQQVPEQNADGVHKELLAMAYLYTSSKLDGAENYEKAKSLYSQLAAAGAYVRFYVSRARDSHKPTQDPYLVQAVPGQLVASKTNVQFVPEEGMRANAETWKSEEIGSCTPNDKFGVDSNSFHISLSSAKEVNFRPLHLSREEADLICELIPKAPQGTAPVDTKQKGKKK